VEADYLDEDQLLAALFGGPARVLLIGRRALVALGLPVLTADYDIWVHIDDISELNRSVAGLEIYPSCDPAEARRRGRYVLENGEHIDVLVARAVPTKDGERVEFEEVWSRRTALDYGDQVRVCLPSIDDLIRTKKWSMRDRDVADIRLLEALKKGRQES